MSRQDLIENLTREHPNPQHLGRVEVVPDSGGFVVSAHCPITGASPVLAEERRGVRVIRELPRYAPRSVRRWHRAVVFAMEQRDERETYFKSSRMYEDTLEYSFQVWRESNG